MDWNEDAQDAFMALQKGTMMSRAILVWAPVFDVLQHTELDTLLCVKGFANLLASTVYEHPSDEQRGCGLCVALYLRNNYLERVHSVASLRASGTLPNCWSVGDWLRSFRMHAALMASELAELKRLEGVA